MSQDIETLKRQVASRMKALLGGDDDDEEPVQKKQKTEATDRPRGDRRRDEGRRREVFDRRDESRRRDDSTDHRRDHRRRDDRRDDSSRRREDDRRRDEDRVDRRRDGENRRRERDSKESGSRDNTVKQQSKQTALKSTSAIPTDYLEFFQSQSLDSTSTATAAAAATSKVSNTKQPSKNLPSFLIPKFSTTLANEKMASKKTAAAAAKKKAAAADVGGKIEAAEKVNPYITPNYVLSSQLPGQGRRAARTLKFNLQGKYIDLANQMRAMAQLEKLKQQIAETVKRAGMSTELDLVGDEGVRREPPPDVEWWDVQLLPNRSYDDFFNNSIVPLDDENPLITNLIQHPIPIQPDFDADGGAKNVELKGIMLTKKESKKLRRQNRQEKLREKREKIQLGLLPPEQNKVKLSNFMRVLGDEATLNPTQIETQVRRQVEDRRLAAIKHDAEKQLTTDQKRAKKIAKVAEDARDDKGLIHVCVFRILDLSDKRHQFKVEKNCQQLGLTGTAIVYQNLNLVIVEGGPKGIKKYKGLMLRRIDWENRGDHDEIDNGEDDDEKGGAGADGGENKCVLVWEGVVTEKAYKVGFKIKNFPTEMRVKEFLGKFGIEHYWNAAKNYSAEYC